MVGLRRQFVKPPLCVAKRIDENRARFGSHRPHRGRSFALALDYLSASIRRRRRPGNDQDAILIVSCRSLGKLDLDRRTRDHDALNGGSQVGVVVDGAQARRKRAQDAGKPAPRTHSREAAASVRTLAERNRGRVCLMGAV